uniref:Putative homing endonuclease n=1 Tax=viral metagenome TaxID=1070528 RepID=A0A6M3LA25_9ZZZZ
MNKNSQDVTMGNQQERLFFDMGYILGMIDGEGSYQISPKYKYKNYIIYAPRITVYNNNPYIIQQTIDALKNWDIDCKIYTPKIHGKENRVCYRLYIEGITRCKKLTDVLLNFPSGKRERIKLINDFCNYRLSFTKNKKENETYSNKVEEFRKQLSLLNSEYHGTKSSTTTRFNV